MSTVARGRLRIYLGAAPGVGKTFAMLNEAHRRRDRGTDLVVGLVEVHGRRKTAEALAGLEVLPRRTLDYRGASFTEMDVDAVLARRPEVALVDELAHTNVPGSRNEKRWQDIDELLDAGIDVISTLNIQHLESLNDVVTKITGVVQRETVPDAVVRAADQVELVDMTAEALRRRMAHGNIYPADKIDAALSNYFRVGNLTALRELALLWLADKVDEQMERYRREHDIAGLWEARERVVVCLAGGSEGDALIRRATRIAARVAGGDLLAVHVSRSDGLTGASPADLARQRMLVESLGGSYHQVVGDDIPRALIEFARAENATQLVLGTRHRGRLSTLLNGTGTGATVVRLSGDIDVHIITYGGLPARGRLPGRLPGLPRRRRSIAVAVAVVLLPALTVVLTQLRDQLDLPSVMLLYLLVVVAVALVGGLYPAVGCALAATLLINYYFTQPLYSFTVLHEDDVLAIVVFVLVALLVSSVVEVAARRTAQASRAAAEAQTLSVLAGSVLRGETAVPALLERLRETFGMTSVTLLQRDDSASWPPRPGHGRRWAVVAGAGAPPCHAPAEADTEIPVGETHVLALRGRVLPAADRRVLAAFAAQAAVVIEQQRLTEAAEAAKPLAEADRIKAALLAAVSHELRTPLASAKAAVASLRGSEVSWTPAERAELLATADESLDSLTRLVANLLDMSRLQAGAMSTSLRPVALDMVVARALDELGPTGDDVTLRVPADLPAVQADETLLERVVANLVANAARHSPPEKPVMLSGSALGDRVELRVIDCGPGIPESERERMFAPFERANADGSAGLGLGLALSRGFAEAMGATLVPEDTPGGGLTMVLSLSVAATAPGGWQAVGAQGARAERGSA